MKEPENRRRRRSVADEAEMLDEALDVIAHRHRPDDAVTDVERKLIDKRLDHAGSAREAEPPSRGRPS